MTDPRSVHASGGGRGRSRREPRPVADLVGRALRSLGVPSASVSDALRRAWGTAADDRWRDVTSLRRIEGGVLEIGVASESLRAELTQFHRDRLLAVLRAAAPDVALIALRFVTDPADGEGV